MSNDIYEGARNLSTLIELLIFIIDNYIDEHLGGRGRLQSPEIHKSQPTVILGFLRFKCSKFYKIERKTLYNCAFIF